MSKCKGVQCLELPKILDPRGNLSFLEDDNHIPFKISRVYWIYDVPGGETRGGHAFKEQEEVIIAISGSFDVLIDDGKEKEIIHLNRSYQAVYVPNGTWRSLDNFSTNSVVFILASTQFDKNDYIYDYNEFVNFNYLKSSLPKIRLRSEIKNYLSASIYNCNVIELNKNHEVKGNLTVVENNITVPFDIKRVYYLYDIPGGEERGGHAHKDLRQLIIAASGSFDVVIDDGHVKRTITLNRPYQGLLIVPGIWRELVNFSSGAVCLVLASERYDEKDYLRDYSEFIDFKENDSSIIRCTK